MRRLELIGLLCLALPAAAAQPRTGGVTGSVRVAGQKQPVTNAIVYLGNVRTALPANSAPITLDQQRNEFVPRVQFAPSGGTVIIQNSDPYLHVLRIETLSHTNAPQTLVRLATPYAGFEKRYKLPTTNEPLLLRARGENGFEKMTAYIAVLPHPWAATTDETGLFRLTGIPPGEYRLFAWHEQLGTLAAGRVRIARGRDTEVLLEFPRKK